MKSNKKQVRRGHCENFTNCALADNGDIQEIPTGDDFICSLCKSELVEEPIKPKKWIWWCLCAIVIVTIVLICVCKCGGHNPEPVEVFDTIYNECGDTLYLKGTDTLEIKTNTRVDTTYSVKGDTILIQGCDTIDIKHYVEKPKPPKPIEDNDFAPRELPVYGKYYGPRNSSNAPHGEGGRVDVTIEYHWKHFVFSPGDRIVNTVFENGQLRHGKVITKTGSSYEI